MLIGVSGLIGSGKDATAKCIQALDCWYNQYGNKMVEFENYTDIQFCKDVLEDKVFSGCDVIHTSWSIKKYATKLKQVASILLDCNVEDFERIEFKNSLLPREWQVEGEPPRTYRHLLQTIGTNCIRNHYNEKAWILSMFNTYKRTLIPYPEGEYNVECEICGEREQDVDKRMILCRKCYVERQYPDWVISDARYFNEIDAIKERGGYMIRVDRGQDAYQNHNPLSAGLTANHTSELEWQQFNGWDYVIDNNGTLEDLIMKVKNIMVELELIKI